MSQNQTEGSLAGMAALAAARPDAPNVFKIPLPGYVPVSFVAKEWGVSPRRIRALLAAGRLAGQVQENGYWEVYYPYRLILGTRGPSLRRKARPKKPERRAE